MTDRSKDTFVRLPEVRRRTTLSRSTIYRLINANKFPAPVKLSVNMVAWYETDINLWVSNPAGWRDPSRTPPSTTPGGGEQ